MVMNTKEDWPNGGGFAWGSNRTKATVASKDAELRTKIRAKGKTEGAGKPGQSVGHKYY